MSFISLRISSLSAFYWCLRMLWLSGKVAVIHAAFIIGDSRDVMPSRRRSAPMLTNSRSGVWLACCRRCVRWVVWGSTVGGPLNRWLSVCRWSVLLATVQSPQTFFASSCVCVCVWPCTVYRSWWVACGRLTVPQIRGLSAGYSPAVCDNATRRRVWIPHSLRWWVT